MELPLSDVQDKARRADWARGADGALDLALVCEHPAMHDAFEDIARRATRAVETIRTGLRLPATMAGRLPREFTSRGLRPATWQDDEPAYDAPLSRFQIAEEKVRELLMGRQLYGDPALAIRELYQNALDACRWRATRQEYLQRTGQSPRPWTGLIRFTQGTENGRPYIDCEDNGVGMDLNTLKHVFANAGERFVYGQDFRAEQAAWAALSPPLRMVPNSQFGVGVFSYFMLADEITVHTRRHGRNDVADQDAHEVRIASSGSLFQIRRAAGMAGGGTRIRLYLSGDMAGISVLDTLRDLLWVAEHRVEVTGAGDSWAAGELHYQEPAAKRDFTRIRVIGRPEAEPGAVKPLKCGRDLWWVPGIGGLTADGIRTGEQIPGLVVNLRGEHRPQFTVDRKTLSAWDEDWVVSQARAYLPELIAWPGFTLAWLWNVAHGYEDGYEDWAGDERKGWDGDAALAQRIFEFAVAAGHHAAVGDAKAQAPVPLSVVGCIAADEGLFGSYGRSAASWLLAWRQGVWRDLGHALAETSDWAVPVRTDGYPVPDAVDGVLLMGIARSSAGPYAFTGDISKSCDEAGLGPGEGIQRLRKYAITGIDLREGRQLTGTGGFLDPEDASILDAFALWPPPGEPEAPELVACLVRTAAQLSMPLTAVLGRLRSLARDGWEGPVPDLALLVASTGPDAERIIRALGDGTVTRWLEKGELGPADLAERARALGLPVGEILGLCDGLARLGVAVASREDYPADLGDTELLALTYVAMPGQSLKPLDLALIAGSTGDSVGTVHRALARLEERGLLARPGLPGPAGFAPSEREMELLGTTTRRLPKARGIGMGALRVPTGHPEPDVRWIRIIEIITLRRDSDARLLAAARNVVPYLPPPEPLTSPELAELAYCLQVPLGAAVSALREVYPGAAVPPLDPESGSLTVSHWLRSALLDSEEGYKVSWRLDVFEVVRHALLAERPLGDCLGELAPFRRLGAPVPPCDDATRTGLNRVRLDGYDVDMLVQAGMFGREMHLPSISALHLVKTAGRLGWPLATAHERFARLVPVGLELAYPQADLPVELVHWYDLQALTTYFDGQEPVISGAIDQAYLEHAAGEIFHGTPPEEIPAKAALLRGRLRMYAPLFELDLPGEGC
jgi:hypothetical protein